jgi:ABC-type antimicrobial peptide transport system permease subunit
MIFPSPSLEPLIIEDEEVQESGMSDTLRKILTIGAIAIGVIIFISLLSKLFRKKPGNPPQAVTETVPPVMTNLPPNPNPYQNPPVENQIPPVSEPVNPPNPYDQTPPTPTQPTY